MAGCNIESFLSCFGDGEEVKVSSFGFFQGSQASVPVLCW